MGKPVDDEGCPVIGMLPAFLLAYQSGGFAQSAGWRVVVGQVGIECLEQGASRAVVDAPLAADDGWRARTHEGLCQNPAFASAQGDQVALIKLHFNDYLLQSEPATRQHEARFGGILFIEAPVTAQMQSMGTIITRLGQYGLRGGGFFF